MPRWLAKGSAGWTINKEEQLPQGGTDLPTADHGSSIARILDLHPGGMLSLGLVRGDLRLEELWMETPASDGDFSGARLEFCTRLMLWTRRMGGGSMHIIGIIIIGFLAGVVAKLLMPGRDPGGFIVTTLLGIVGAFVATYLGQAIGWYRADEGAGFVGAVVGAVILLAIYHFVKRRSAGSPRYCCR